MNKGSPGVKLPSCVSFEMFPFIVKSEMLSYLIWQCRCRANENCAKLTNLPINGCRLFIDNWTKLSHFVKAHWNLNVKCLSSTIEPNYGNLRTCNVSLKNFDFQPSCNCSCNLEVFFIADVSANMSIFCTFMKLKNYIVIYSYGNLITHGVMMAFWYGSGNFDSG